jgi:hypothetical protein
MSHAAFKPSPNPCARAFVEPLEPRTFLTAVSTAMPADIADKVDPRFYRVSVDLQNNAKNNWLRRGIVRADKQQRIDAYLHLSGRAAEATIKSLQKLGAQIHGTNAGSRLIWASIPAAKMAQAARLAGVVSIGTVDYPTVNTITSAGDSILHADKVRQAFAASGIDGTGIKVGVISDGVKDIASVGAELPAVTVQPSHTGTGDEGVAMLEIVHDLAPGAQLYFSAPTTSVDMVSSINYLVGQGCNVIVDDLTFFGESYFADGQIATAAQNAVNAGVVYVTSAGNYSYQQHYQAQYVDSGITSGKGHLHQFDTGVTKDTLDIPAGSSFQAFLEWSDPFGASSNNYDLYLINSTTGQTLDSGTTLQNGNDNPFEQVAFNNATGSTIHAEIWINKRTSAASRELELFTFGNSSLTYNTPGDALTGQEAVPGVMSVAAASAASPNTVEYYSSRGGSTIYTNFSTQTKVIRQTLDGTAIDGVQTQIGASGIWPHNPFYGTSAAAPHAAAIAALLKEMRPSYTPAQIAQVMADTATDIDAPGYDVNSGAGLYNALDAAYAVFTPPTAPDLADASDAGSSSSDNLTNVATPTFTGVVPGGAYVRLLVDGVQNGAVQLAADATTYSIQPTTPLADGTHSITIRLSSGAGVALVLNSAPSPALSVTIDTVAPTVISPAFSFDAPGQRLTLAFSKDVLASLQAGDLQLTNVDTGVTIPPDDIHMEIASDHSVTFSFPNYANGALPDGNYRVAFTAGSVTDAAGNSVSPASFLDFFVLAGDANHDRSVDFLDLAALAQNYNTIGGKLWIDGDFNADGNVDFTDLAILAQRYNTVLLPPQT